jgi:hypothetical protein
MLFASRLMEQKLSKILTTKHDVPVKEAKLMCFLVTVYQDVLIDVEKTNYPLLIDAIGTQIKAGEIKHPFVSAECFTIGQLSYLKISAATSASMIRSDYSKERRRVCSRSASW